MMIAKDSNDNNDLVRLHELFKGLETLPRRTSEKIQLLDGFIPVGVQGSFSIYCFNPIDNLAITYKKLLLSEKSVREYPSEAERDMKHLGARLRELAKQVETIRRNPRYMDLIQEQADREQVDSAKGWTPMQWLPIAHCLDDRVVITIEKSSMLEEMDALAGFLERVADLAGSRKGRGGKGLNQVKSAKDFLIRNLNRMVSMVNGAKAHVLPIAAKVHEWADAYTEGQFGIGTLRRIDEGKRRERKSGEPRKKKIQ